jgi:hypothetical protein
MKKGYTMKGELKTINGINEWHQESGTNPNETIIFQESPKGTFFHKETPQKVKDILDRNILSGYSLFDVLNNNIRCRLFLDFGDPETGQSWGEVHDTQGTIGRSQGPIKIPLLIQNRRSSGGGAILDHCIVRIRETGKQGRELYRHPTYQPPKVDYPQQAKAYQDVLTQATA